MGDIVIEETNHRAFAMTMANFFMLVASISIFIYGVVTGNKLYKIVSILSSVIFFWGFIVAIMQTAKEKILLTITVDGIIDCSSLGGIGFISYRDIKEFEIIDQHKTKMIAVTLKILKNSYLN